MSKKINFDNINKAIRNIRGSGRYSEFEKKAHELSVANNLAKSQFSKANKMTQSDTMPTSSVEWYGEFDTQEYIVWEDEPTVAELEAIVESAKKEFDKWVSTTKAAIQFAKELAADYSEDGVPRDYNYIQFANDNNHGGDIVRFIPTDEEKSQFAEVKKKAQADAQAEMVKIESDISALENDLVTYSAIWFASEEYAGIKARIRELDAKAGRIRSCKTLSDFLKLFPNPTEEEVSIFDKSR